MTWVRGPQSRFAAMMRKTSLLLAALLLGGAGPDPAPVPVRVGEHPGFGRIVFDFAQPTEWQIAREGNQVMLSFDGVRRIGNPPSLPHNVESFTQGDGRTELVVTPGARLRTMRVGELLVLDVLDPVKPDLRAVPQAVAAHPLDRHDAPPAVQTAPTTAAAPVAAPALPAQPAAPVLPPPAPVPTSPSGPSTPMMLAATQMAAPTGAAGAILVPFGTSVGAAVVPRGDKVLVVFNEARPLDLAALHDDKLFGTAVVHLLPAATVLEMPLPPHMGVALHREPEGWRVALAPRREEMAPIAVGQEADSFRFSAGDPGRAVNVVDPLTGGPLLVGTQHKPGQSVGVRRVTPEFVVLPTWQGVAVEPLSDQLSLQARSQGFALTAAGAPLALTPLSEDTMAMAGAAGLTRRFLFPMLPTAELAAELRTRLAAAAGAPPLSRGGLQRGVAATMIALGMGVEAQAVLRLAGEENPKEAELPDHAGLGAVAALLASRPGQAEGILDPRLSDSDEVALWRAARDAQLKVDRPQAAAAFAATWPLILTYPPAVRERLLPLAVETMIAGGQTKPAEAALAAAPNDGSLALARGLLAEAQGHTDAALAAYDALANGADRLERARAAPRAIALRLASGRIDGATAADALEKLLLSWRGDQRELDLRERLAELRAQLGQGRVALGLLRETAGLFPDRQPEIRERMRRLFATILADPRSDALPPLEFVALIDDNTDLLPSGATGEALELRLADRLAALDLPEKAAPLLEKLMRAAATDVARAGLGARLASLRLHQGDTAGALAALSASSADDLPPPLLEERTLLLAEATARSGNVAAAVSALAALGTAAADDERATILEHAGDWQGADGALRDYAGKTVPDSGALDAAQQRTLLRLATAATRAGDAATLADLQAKQAGRMSAGPLADMFRLLTAGSVHGVADLQRSGQEAVLAHALPEDLKAMQ